MSVSLGGGPPGGALVPAALQALEAHIYIWANNGQHKATILFRDAARRVVVIVRRG